MPDRMSASDFPYAPSAKIDQLHGLNKLRAIADRELAGYMFDLWMAIPAYGFAPRAPALPLMAVRA